MDGLVSVKSQTARLPDLITTTGIEKADLMARRVERRLAGDLSKTSMDEPAAHGTGSRTQSAGFGNALQAIQGICNLATQALQTRPPFSCFRICILPIPNQVHLQNFPTPANLHSDSTTRWSFEQSWLVFAENVCQPDC